MKQSNDKKKPRKERVEERRRKSAHKPQDAQAVDEPTVGSNVPAQRQMQKEKVRDGRKNGKIMQAAREGEAGGDCLMNAFLSRL